MSLHVRPIVSALLRNRLGAALVALQIAVAFAMLVNAVAIVAQRIERMARPTGVDVENVFMVMSQGFTRDYDQQAAIREDLAYLRSLDGVVAATPTTHFPIAGGVYDDVLTAQPGDETRLVYGDYYEVDHQAIDALGLRLVAGRGFAESEILPPPAPGSSATFVPNVIVTQALAEELFPGENALGRTVYNRVGLPATIIGIVERMQAGWVNWDHAENVFLMPRLPGAFGTHTVYIVRTEPGRRDEVIRTAEAHLATSNPDRVIEWVRPLELYHGRAYRADRNLGLFLTAVTVLFLAITSLGIFGLAAFSVGNRKKQIGTRRAVGARRRDIVLHYMVENFLITTTGLVAGCALALAMGHWLSVRFGVPRLEPAFLAGGALALWALGMVAAWPPAQRAARIPPALATRTA